ncbi:unnamed protein product, partial [Polarella glacialis]
MVTHRRVPTARCSSLRRTLLFAIALGGCWQGPPRGVSAARSIDVTLYVHSQDTIHDRAAVNELTSTVVEAGWSHDSVVSMADAQRDFNHQGLWSYLPWIFLEEEQRAKSRKRIAGHAGQRWAVFLEPSTAVDPAALEAVLAGYDAKDAWYLGRSLKDENMVIIHHYQQEP